MGNIDSAIDCYKQASDNLSLCRVYCINENVKAAIELCNDTSDSTACYHLARHFERKKNIKEAINYYQRAGAISNAIRLCKVINPIDLSNILSLRIKEIFSAQFNETNLQDEDMFD